MKSISVIKAKFNRFKLKSNLTKLFEQLNETEKNLLASNIEFNKDEEIIICFIPNYHYWWILTNFKIIINDNQQTNYVFLNNIDNIDIKDILSTQVNKLNCEILHLNTKTGESIDLTVELNTWHAMYNILKFAID